jgi:hypothetical protein
MNIHAKPGAKVIVTADTITNGYPIDQQKVNDHLKIDRLYQVEKTEVFEFITNVFLTQFPGIPFNSVNFKDTIELDGLTYVVDDTLAGYAIYQAESTTITFIGYEAKKRRLFAQFKSGKSYIYHNVPTQVITDAMAAESLTKYLMPAVNGFSFTKFDFPLIKLADI